jgi:hypothetical protein
MPATLGGNHVIYEHRIITDWPGELRPYAGRTATPFKVDWNKTLDDLERELEKLRAKDVILETAHRDGDVRMNGTVNASATPLHPGVILSFDSRHGPLRYFTDAYDAWRANVRAIGLGLEALRAVDRYGISGRGEQYTGFAHLMAAKLAMTPERARAVLAETAGFNRAALVGADPDQISTMYRMAAKRVHPDVAGEREKWDELAEAAEKLGVKR